MSELGEIRRDIDKISRKLDRVIDALISDAMDALRPDVRSSAHDGELAAAEAQAKLNRLIADAARVRVGDVRAAFDAYHQGLADASKARIDQLLANAECEVKPEPITTGLECTGIDQYAIEIEHAGRRVRYEAPSVDGVHALMCAHSDYNMGITPDMKVNP